MIVLSFNINYMSRKLVFLRHGKLELPYESHNDMPFDVLRALGNQTMDPPSDIKYLESRKDYLQKLLHKFKFSKIFRSPSLRCSTLEGYIRSIASDQLPPTEEINELREILFDLNLLFPSQNASVEEIGPKLITEILVGGPGAESVETVLRRLNDTIERMPQSGDILILTHGFFMRLISSINGNMGNQNKPTTPAWEAAPRFKYLEGFILEKDKPIQYILAPQD